MDQKQQVFQWLEAHGEEMASFLGELIRIPSVNRTKQADSSEYAFQQHLQARMEEWGFPTTQRTYDAEGLRPNVMASYVGTGGGKDLMLHAHADTMPVAAHEHWSFDPFSGEFDGTYIYGRGAGDDKWGIAAGLYVLRALKECGVQLKGTVHMLASSGEESCEGGTLGAGPFVRDMEKRPDFCMVCESTVMEICTETHCTVGFNLHVPGKALHACYRNIAVFPQPGRVLAGYTEGVDALEKALPIIEALYRLERDLSINYKRPGMAGKGGDGLINLQGVGAIMINPNNISGSGNGSTMAGVDLQYTVTMPVTYTPEEMLDIITDTVMSVARTDLWLREHPPTVTRRSFMPGFMTEISHPGVQTLRSAFKDAMGRDAVISAWKPQCDGSFLNPYVPCVVFGPYPVGPHAADERITLKEILDSAKVFASMAMEYCK